MKTLTTKERERLEEQIRLTEAEATQYEFQGYEEEAKRLWKKHRALSNKLKKRNKEYDHE